MIGSVGRAVVVGVVGALRRAVLADLLLLDSEADIGVGTGVEIALVIEHELVRQFSVQRLHVVVRTVAAA